MLFWILDARKPMMIKFIFIHMRWNGWANERQIVSDRRRGKSCKVKRYENRCRPTVVLLQQLSNVLRLLSRSNVNIYIYFIYLYSTFLLFLKDRETSWWDQLNYLVFLLYDVRQFSLFSFLPSHSRAQMWGSPENSQKSFITDNFSHSPKSLFFLSSFLFTKSLLLFWGQNTRLHDLMMMILNESTPSGNRGKFSTFPRTYFDDEIPFAFNFNLSGLNFFVNFMISFYLHRN